MLKKSFLIAFLTVFMSLVGLRSMAQDTTIIDVATANKDFSAFLKAVDAAGLTDTLRDASASYTVFAPTNGAFIKFYIQSKITEQEALANPELLKAILTYHVLPAAVTSDKLVAGSVEPVYPYGATVAIADGKVMLNDANVVTADIMASNGVIHAIDKVLVPPLCLATTDVKTTTVFVGPGKNRSHLVYLPVGKTIPVLGQTKDKDDNVWYQVNKKDAAPGSKAKETWILSSEVTAVGPTCASLPKIKVAK